MDSYPVAPTSKSNTAWYNIYIKPSVKPEFYFLSDFNAIKIYIFFNSAPQVKRLTVFFRHYQ